MAPDNPYRHAFERTWNAVDALCSTRPLKQRVGRASEYLMPLTRSNLPVQSAEILDELSQYFSCDTRAEEARQENLVSVFKNNEQVMTGNLARHFAERIKTFAFHVFFARPQEAN